MSRLFEQAGSMNFQCAATNGGLTGEFRLNFRPDVNGDCHGPPPSFTVPPPFGPVKLGLSPSPYARRGWPLHTAQFTMSPGTESFPPAPCRPSWVLGREAPTEPPRIAV